METAIYCRVSTEEQAQEGFSIRAQEQKLKEYSNVKDWSIYNFYIDEGISGKNITERPAVLRMIEDIKAGHVKNVLVFKLDRLTRSVADLVYLIDLFKANRCDFNSLMESIDTSTASGRMFIKIIGIFAEFERENIAERVRIGKERKAREGFTTGCHYISYGYDRANGERVQTVNEDEAQRVRMIFDMYVNKGMSLNAIGRSFNMQKITTKKGFMWNAASIKAVLTNCNYIGNVRYAILDPDRNFETVGKHEAIISEKLYNAAQALIKKNGRTAPTKKPDEHNYFVNFLYCAECGEKYLPHNTVYNTQKGKTTLYNFQCRTRHLKGACGQKAITAKRVELALIEYFATYVDVFTTNGTSETLLQQEKQNNESQIKNYKEQLRHYDNREKEVMSHYISGAIEFESYRDMKKQLDGDRDYIRVELAKLTVDEGENQPATINREEVAASFRENWQDLTNGEKRLFLTKYIKKIMVSNVPVEGERFGNTKVIDIEFNRN